MCREEMTHVRMFCILLMKPQRALGSINVISSSAAIDPRSHILATEEEGRWVNRFFFIDHSIVKEPIQTEYIVY